ncbi:hypothetical protein E2I00_015573, partial [Balaenoptera physalus]
ALLERGRGAVFLFRPLPCNAKSLGPADSAPKPVQPVVWEKGGTWEGQQEVPEAASPSPARTAEPLGLWMLQTDPRTDRQLDAWPGHEAQGGTVFSSDGTVAAADPPPSGDESGLFSLPAPAPERISYVPQFSSATLAGRLTQSTFTLEQPRGQFSHLNISDFDAIWLVLAHSNGGPEGSRGRCCRGCGQRLSGLRVEDTPVPANFPQTGYYVTLRANRALYPGGQPGNQLRVLHVGNDTRCSPMTRGCNHPLPGPGPYRVKFLVVRDRGPMAETEWSSETRLQQAEALQAAPGPQSAGTVAIVAILS